MNALLYYLIKFTLIPLRFIPFSVLRGSGKCLGWILYKTIPHFRKRALSNLALATSLSLSPKEIQTIALQSLQNIAINLLEFPKWGYIKNTKSRLHCINSEEAASLTSQGQGVIFFCGHLSNWEVLFWEGTQRMNGVAIGRPIKNKRLYAWITELRQRFGGSMIPPSRALIDGMKALKKGKFMGIVGDQGMPESGFSSLFLGRRAWTTPAPAILAYRTKCPVIVATTKRTSNGYVITYSDPIWPNLSSPMEEEVPKLMTSMLAIFETAVKESPGEWLWLHNRWKQETARNVFYRYRFDSILCVLPKAPDCLSSFIQGMESLRLIYPHAFLTIMLPVSAKNTFSCNDVEILYYENTQELLRVDYRFKFVLDFSNHPKVKSHYKALSAHLVLSLNDLMTLSHKADIPYYGNNPSSLLIHALCRPEFIRQYSKDVSHATI